MGLKTGPKSPYGDEVQEKAEWYLNGGYRELDQVIPSGAGLARYLGVHRRTLYKWAEVHPAFKYALESMNDEQEVRCLNNGLTGKFTPIVTKLILARHGYHDKTDSNLTSSDGSMSPKDNSLAVLEALKRKHK